MLFSLVCLVHCLYSSSDVDRVDDAWLVERWAQFPAGITFFRRGRAFFLFRPVPMKTRSSKVFFLNVLL